MTVKSFNRTNIPLTPESEVGYTRLEKAVPHDKGKPSERWRRKATGLRLKTAMIAGLPKEEGVRRLFLDATRRGAGFLVCWLGKRGYLAGLKIAIQRKGGETNVQEDP